MIPDFTQGLLRWVASIPLAGFLKKLTLLFPLPALTRSWQSFLPVGLVCMWPTRTAPLRCTLLPCTAGRTSSSSSWSTVPAWGPAMPARLSHSTWPASRATSRYWCWRSGSADRVRTHLIGIPQSRKVAVRRDGPVSFLPALRFWEAQGRAAQQQNTQPWCFWGGANPHPVWPHRACPDSHPRRELPLSYSRALVIKGWSVSDHLCVPPAPVLCQTV